MKLVQKLTVGKALAFAWKVAEVLWKYTRVPSSFCCRGSGGVSLALVVGKTYSSPFLCAECGLGDGQVAAIPAE